MLGATANNKTIDDSNSWSGLTTLSAYREDLQYDGNGNILGYARNGNKTNMRMDSLHYVYQPGNNRLDHVLDSVPGGDYGGAGGIADIDNQSSGNYGYDAIGNLVRDDAEGITNIKWTVYGKIAEIDKTANANQPITKINYSYDAQGNRTGSITEQNDGTKKYTWYVRDAQGNVLATYGAQGPGTELSALNLSLTERHLYGSSVLGMYTQSVNVDNGAAAMTDSNGIQYYRGYRQYALSNHLGNVLSTVSDRKSGTDRNGDGQIDYYDADICTAQDYYAFGMTMPGRNYTAANASAYRYGFNGKENDNEVKGTGNQQDYGMRIYDPRLGRFLSEDPLTKKYPELTPYQFASNTPIQAIDLDGLEEYHYTMTMGNQGQARLHLDNVKTVNHHSWFGGLIEFDTKIDTKKYAVKYEGKTYHIGFAQYGVGYANAWKADQFNADYIKKHGNAVDFENTYVDDKHSQAGSDAALVVKSQNIGLETAIPFDDLVAPKGWPSKPSKKGGGIIYQDPENSHNSVRVMPGNPNSPNKAQQDAYIVFKKNGVAYDKNGQPLKNPNDPAAHISAKDYNLNKMPASNKKK